MLQDHCDKLEALENASLRGLARIPRPKDCRALVGGVAATPLDRATANESIRSYGTG